MIKSSLPKLRVTEDWFADRSRIIREAACLRVIAKYVGEEFAPRVIREDDEKYACLLECAPEGTVTWKQDLLEGKVDRAVTQKVAYFLSRFHASTRDDKQIQKEFSDQSNFVQLRINPYLVRVSERHPDLQQQIDEIIAGLLTEKLCLVHGDFSPKNILLLSDSRVWMIDCEVAHYGNPAFDVAFCANHLILKAIHLSSLSHLEEAKKFWNQYWRDSGWSSQEQFTTRVLGGLMLARVDGKSPVEYLNEQNRAIVRDLSKRFVFHRVDEFTNLVTTVEEAVRKR